MQPTEYLRHLVGMKILLFGALFVALAIQTFAQTDTISGDYRLRGTVKDQTGAVFAGLNLYIRKGDKDRTFSTDINGEFEIALQPGEYEITVNKLYSNSFKAFIKIQEGGLNPNGLAFVLDSSRICCTDSDGKPFPKPISLPKPPFPPAARAVRASGEVIVTVNINPDGKVLSAIANNGHPLLRRTAEAIAKKALFEPAEMETERTAELIYVFLLPEDQKDHIRHYVNPYRIEIIGEFVVINASVQKN